jgi:hypothetical protein
MSHFDHHLPVLENPDDDQDSAVCSPSIYVSNEEAALLDGMRQLRERSAAVKRDLHAAAADARPALEKELEGLRTQWKALARQREKAYIRKMIMLGHLPPGYLDEREG